MKQGASFAKKQGTLIALACAAAFAVPQVAVAQVATPDFGSGKGLTLSVDFVIGLASKEAKSATAANSNSERRTEVWSSSSSVYFKGSEKLGGSIIQGWGFVITWDYDPDEYNRRGANEVGQTILGLQTPAGAFFLGVNDNPFKQIGSVNVATTSTFGNGLSQSGNLGTPGFRTGTAKGSRNGSAAEGVPSTTSTMSFYRLNSNSVNWYSPSWNGFKLYAQWVPGDSDVPAGVTTLDDMVAYSIGATFATGPFNIGYVYERRDDYLWGAVLTGNNFGAGTGAAGVGTSSKDQAHLLTAGFQFGNFKLGGYYQRMEYEQSGGTTVLKNMDVDSWYLGARWRAGPHEVGAFYFFADDLSCGGANNLAATTLLVSQCSNETGVQAYGIGYRYTVSKQLRLFVSASQYDNDDRAQYAGHSSASRVGVGNPTNPSGLKLINYSVGVTGSF